MSPTKEAEKLYRVYGRRRGGSWTLAFGPGDKEGAEREAARIRRTAGAWDEVMLVPPAAQGSR